MERLETTDLENSTQKQQPGLANKILRLPKKKHKLLVAKIPRCSFRVKSLPKVGTYVTQAIHATLFYRGYIYDMRMKRPGQLKFITLFDFHIIDNFSRDFFCVVCRIGSHIWSAES